MAYFGDVPQQGPETDSVTPGMASLSRCRGVLCVEAGAPPNSCQMRATRSHPGEASGDSDPKIAGSGPWLRATTQSPPHCAI